MAHQMMDPDKAKQMGKIMLMLLSVWVVFCFTKKVVNAIATVFLLIKTAKIACNYVGVLRGSTAK